MRGIYCYIVLYQQRRILCYIVVLLGDNILWGIKRSTTEPRGMIPRRIVIPGHDSMLNCDQGHDSMLNNDTVTLPRLIVNRAKIPLCIMNPGHDCRLICDPGLIRRRIVTHVNN